MAGTLVTALSSQQQATQDPNAMFKLAALFAIISIVVVYPTTSLLVEPIQIALISSLLASVLTILVYKFCNENEKSLTRRLRRIQKAVTNATSDVEKKPIRVWLDGCFDLCHVGHFNAWRQAKMNFGDILVVGINPDVEVLRYKGPPIYTQEERYVMAKACKWVDEVVENVPYVLDEEYLLTKVLSPDGFNCDIVTHGDDPCIAPDGSDVFAAPKKLGKYREYKRTEGVSTTDYIGRMLSLTKSHHNKDTIREIADTNNSDSEESEDESTTTENEKLRKIVQDGDSAINTGNFERVTAFMPTTRRLTQFATGKPKRPEQVTVFCDGTWDLFNPAHVDFLKAIHEYGQANNEDYYIIVGVYTDNVANALHGENYPILNLQERVLSALSCRYIDDLVIGSPYKLTREFIINLGIKKVFHGTINDTRPHLQAQIHNDQDLARINGVTHNPVTPPASPTAHSTSLDPYEYPRQHKMLIELKSPRNLTIKSIIQRVIAQKQAFEAKFEKKSKAEQQYRDTQTAHIQEL